jgi:transposase
MAIVAQKSLWEEIEELGDLERFVLVLRTLPDEALMRTLERERGKGRNDYPIRAMWNSLLAGVVFGHESIESLRRELARNAQLRLVCGFDPLKGGDAVPLAWTYSRFLRSLFGHQEAIDAMFDALVELLRRELDGFGAVLAIDGKAIPSHARGRKKKEEEEEEEPRQPDGRRETDADWGAKSYTKKAKDGSLYKKVKHWFGFKLHLVVDATYELPVAYTVTEASENDIEQAPVLIERLKKRQRALMQACGVLAADKGYDDGKFITSLWDDKTCRIKPVIAIRNCWQDGEATKAIAKKRNVVYDYEGNVYCYCLRTGKRRAMAYAGFEADRETLKYRCPCTAYGLPCRGRARCPVKGSVRIPLSEDRRVFTPVARSSYTWKRTYKKRTAVERVNSRLDVSFGFERHFIRGLAKMRMRMGLALVVMLAMALGRTREKRAGLIRSLVRAA